MWAIIVQSVPRDWRCEKISKKEGWEHYDFTSEWLKEIIIEGDRSRTWSIKGRCLCRREIETEKSHDFVREEKRWEEKDRDRLLLLLWYIVFCRKRERNIRMKIVKMETEARLPFRRLTKSNRPRRTTTTSVSGYDLLKDHALLWEDRVFVCKEIK